MFIKTPEHKIDLVEPNFGGSIDTEDDTKIKEVFLGATLRSHFGFPLQVEIEEMSTRFDDRVPKKELQDNQIIDVGMQGSCFFNDESIDTTGQT